MRATLKGLFLFCIYTTTLLGAQLRATMGSGGVNAPDKLNAPYLILISIDGFRWDYPDLFPTPAIHQLAARGVKAESMVPVFPTQTFPNHYSIVTGLYPAHHGIVANKFRDGLRSEWYIYKQKTSAQDGRWYGGEPVWVAAENAGMVTAAFFFVGTEAAIQGVRPSHWRPFDPGISGKHRVDQVLHWLSEPACSRPHFITLYFEQVDDSAHIYGPTASETGSAIALVDGRIRQLTDGLASLAIGDQVSIVLVSDHGEARYSPGIPPFIISNHFDLSGITPVDGGNFSFLYFDQADRDRAITLRDGINRTWACGHAYLPEDAPASWHVDTNPRYADLLVQADPGCAVLSSQESSAQFRPGAHGWPPEMPEMRGIFIAAGPALPRGLEIAPVNAVDIYPLLMRLLGLEPRQDVDSDQKVLTKLLQ